jgi:Domain of unknown function (DUF4372)
MEFLPNEEFDGSIGRHRENRRMLGFSRRNQFLCFAVQELTSRESLRDIETCLEGLKPKLYRTRILGKVARSTFFDANRPFD